MSGMELAIATCVVNGRDRARRVLGSGRMGISGCGSSQFSIVALHAAVTESMRALLILVHPLRDRVLVVGQVDVS